MSRVSSKVQLSFLFLKSNVHSLRSLFNHYSLIHMDNLRSHQTEKVKREVCDVLDNIWSTYRVGEIDTATKLPCCKPVTCWQRDGYNCGMFLLLNTVGFLNIRNGNFLKSDFKQNFNAKVTRNYDLFNRTLDDLQEERKRLVSCYNEIHHIKAHPLASPPERAVLENSPAAAAPTEVESCPPPSVPFPAATSTPAKLGTCPSAADDPHPPVQLCAATAPAKLTWAERKKRTRINTHYRKEWERFMKTLAGKNFKKPAVGEYWFGDISSGKFIEFQQLTGPFDVNLYGTNGKRRKSINAVIGFDEQTGRYIPIEYDRVKRGKKPSDQITCGIWHHKQITGFIKFDNEHLRKCLVQWQQGVDTWLTEEEAMKVDQEGKARKRAAPDRLVADENGNLTSKKMKEGNGGEGNGGAWSDTAWKNTTKLLRDIYFTTKDEKGKTQYESKSKYIQCLLQQHGEFHRAVEFTKVLAQPDRDLRRRNEAAFLQNEPMRWKKANRKLHYLDEMKQCNDLFIVNLVFEVISGKRACEKFTLDVFSDHKEETTRSILRMKKLGKCLHPKCDNDAHTVHRPFCRKHGKREVPKRERPKCIYCNRNKQRHAGGRCKPCHTNYYADKPDELRRSKFCSECLVRPCRVMGGLCSKCSNDPATFANVQKRKAAMKKKGGVM